MATVTNWIDHLSAAEVQGAVYPGVGTEGIMVIVLLVIWILSDTLLTDLEVSIADMTNDGLVNVLDIVALVNTILNP